MNGRTPLIRRAPLSNDIKKTMPKVSVIIPSYNHERYVSEAIQSVLDQTFQDFEIIIVDDASSDGTIAAIEKMQDPRIRLVKAPHNRAVHTRNTALRLAQGEYVAFQNSDDVWDRSKLEKQIEILESQPSTRACFTAVQPIDEKSTPLGGSWIDQLFTTKNRSSTEWLRNFFETGNCLCITSAVVRREKIEALGRFRESLIQMGDFDLWVRLAALGDFHIIDTPLTRMRIFSNKGNVSAPTKEAGRRSAMECAEILSRYAEAPVLDSVPQAFSFIFDAKARSSAAYVAGLARYAWQFGVAHHMFADRILARLIDNPKTREEIVEAYGHQIILDFIKRRGALDISLT